MCYTDGMQLPMNHLQQVVNGTLTILKVRKTYDAGKYTCSAENSDGQGMDRSVYVNVVGKCMCVGMPCCFLNPMWHLLTYLLDESTFSLRGISSSFLPHLSRRLVGELIVYPCSGVRPSSVVRPSVVHNFKHEYLCKQLADHNEILSEASLGWRKGCIRFWARSDPNSGFHGNK